MKKKSKKNVILTVIEDLIIAAGLLILVYPYASDWWNVYNRSQEISSYTSSVDAQSLEENEEQFLSAVAYNEETQSISAGSVLTEEQEAAYDSQLSIGGTEVMGYIQIDKIDCTLPIYHGTDEDVLQVAVGHLPWSSLPVGNEGSHAVLSGHRGLPSAKLFTRLDEMELGDTFDVYILNHKMTYEVDQIETVLPTDVTYLEKEENQALCTLVTCTPYGINTHRLLVRGHLISNETVSTEELTETAKSAENHNILIMVLAVFGIVVLVIIIIALKKYRRRRKAEKQAFKKEKKSK